MLPPFSWDICRGLFFCIFCHLPVPVGLSGLVFLKRQGLCSLSMVAHVWDPKRAGCTYPFCCTLASMNPRLKGLCCHFDLPSFLGPQRWQCRMDVLSASANLRWQGHGSILLYVRSWKPEIRVPAVIVICPHSGTLGNLVRRFLCRHLAAYLFFGAYSGFQVSKPRLHWGCGHRLCTNFVTSSLS